MRKPKAGTLVLVAWADIEHSITGWRDLADVLRAPPARCRSVGRVLRSGRRFLVLSPTVSDHDDALCGVRIPWGAVRSWRRLR